MAKNNFYSVAANTSDPSVMNFLHEKIQHVIYIVKENRTFDQMLGDLTNGADADPSLVQFGSVSRRTSTASRSQLRHAGQLHGPRRRQHGWLVLVHARPYDQHGEVTQQINYAGVEPRPVL